MKSLFLITEGFRRLVMLSIGKILPVLVLAMTAVSIASAESSAPVESFLWSPEIASYVGQFIATDESAVENKDSLLYRVYLSSPSNRFNPGTDVTFGLCADGFMEDGRSIEHALEALMKIPDIEGLPGKIMREVYGVDISRQGIIKELFIPESLHPLFNTINAYRGFGNSLYGMTQRPTIGNYFSAVRAIPHMGFFRVHTLILESLVYTEVAILEKEFNGPVDKALKGQRSELDQEIDQYWRADKINRAMNAAKLSGIQHAPSISSVLMNKPATINPNLSLSSVTRMYTNPSLKITSIPQISNLRNQSNFSSSQFNTRQLNRVNVPRQTK